ncbi:hypothetical protein GCM10010992_15020 [Cloacibacterium rupense]|uniref:DUF6576 domain-containing protein n=2 Tax=Cloacibacterium rupense TaxID=517423 RepID=A0ABQ2NIA5_9FLAO|nr:hypothetical protein GCM10010992_15020 [Cloacibacterium rupense]
MNTIFIGLIILVLIVFLMRNTIKEKFSTDKTKNYTIDDRYNAAKREREKEIDHLLSKMGKNGIDDLNEKDRKRLNELSQK